MKKAVIFDLDGTLIDSLGDITDCLNEMLKKFNHKQVEKDFVITCIGNGARKLVERATQEKLTNDELDQRLAFYNEKYANLKEMKTKVFDGMDYVLKELKNKGFKLAILTNKPQVNTEEIYNILLSKYNFDLVYGEAPGRKVKPDKSLTMQVLNELNVLPEETFFVGDGDTDFLTAVNSNTVPIAVLWGNRTKEQLMSIGATTFVNTPKELLEYILNN